VPVVDSSIGAAPVVRPSRLETSLNVLRSLNLARLHHDAATAGRLADDLHEIDRGTDPRQLRLPW
jgi:hypothetical protein